MKTAKVVCLSMAILWVVMPSTAQQLPLAQSGAVPTDQIGAMAGKQYSGDGLAVTAAEEGARLRCMFQRLEGEVTRQGLWLSSTAEHSKGERFRVVAVEVGRGDKIRETNNGKGSLSSPWPMVARTEPEVSAEGTLPGTGELQVLGRVARFVRPVLTEEYSVSVDGVRQDFILERRPGGQGQVRVDLDLAGARPESSINGAWLVLESSGRKLNYNRVRATDAEGRELPVRMQVVEQHGLRRKSCAGPALILWVDDAQASYPVRIDPTFSDADWFSMGGGINGVDGWVWATAVDSAGNLYIGGNFGMVVDTFAANVAKWDGHKWSALGSGTSAAVHALAVSGTNLYAGGGFTNAGGAGASCIAKWDGHAWSAMGLGLNGGVGALAVSGSDVYAGGGFARAGEMDAQNIAKWDGNQWSALGSGLNGQVRALAVSGSDLYAGGDFTLAGGLAANYVAKWDGSAWSALGSGIGGGPVFSSVYALAVWSSNLFVGGRFGTAGDVSAANIAKWDGSAWSALGLGINPSPLYYAWVYALAASSNGLYAAANDFSGPGLDGATIAKWDGNTWSVVGPWVGIEMGPHVFALAASGDYLYAGGMFDTAGSVFDPQGGVKANGIAKWDGTNWSAFLGMGPDGAVGALAVAGGDTYMGGDFQRAGAIGATNIAKWNGSAWSALGSGINGPVSRLAVFGGDLYAGGTFSAADGVGANNIAKWDGNNWSALGSGMDGPVSALAMSRSNLYAGGSFTNAGGVGATNIARWDGVAWSTLGSGINGAVLALAVSGNELYAGGSFTSAGGVSANSVAKWDGSVWLALGSGMDGPVHALAVSGTNLYAAGWFTTAGGISANSIAKWDGTAWSSLGSGMNTVGFSQDGVLALVVSGNDLYAAGNFTTAGGNSANYIAKWDGSVWSGLGSGLNGEAYALAVSGSDLFVGGGFTTAGNKISPFVARANIGGRPLLSSSYSGANLILSWPSAGSTGFSLEQTSTVTTPASWTTSTASVTDDGTNKSVIVPATNGFEFFRLSRP